jgi:DNA repair protein RecN (Recombination protein N)
MLRSLSIRNVAAVDRLTAAFAGPGLVALTGETGAGKSVLLTALSLALGARASARLIRPGADKATTTGAFTPPEGHPAWDALAESGVEADASEPLLLRRAVTADGRSTAYINDQAVSARLLASVGAEMVEIHGQFAAQELLTPATHRVLLDAYAGVGPQLHPLWAAWHEARLAREALEDGASRAARDADAIRADLEALAILAPQAGEEAILAARRARLMGAERAAEALAAARAALESEHDPLGAAAAALARVEGARPALDALARAQAEAAEALALVRAMEGDAGAEGELEAVDDRLHALRSLARRMGCAPDALPERTQTLQARLALLEDGGAALTRAQESESKARAAYTREAERLSAARAKAAKKLERAVRAELSPLKLDKARFAVVLEALEEARWGPGGLESVRFLFATLPGAAPAPLDEVASGGEAARLMLALRSVLAACGPAKTIVFDEVDASIGGAVAAAVGARLAALAARHQVMVVTHAPQVAARAAQHWHVAKGPGGTTRLSLLESPEARAEEIARMLSGAAITDEARAAAERLLEEG